MAEGGALEMFREIQSLVSDKLQVVSYKWLSRNFSVSSNHAKRLLHEFVGKHGNELEVVYCLSGWLKNTSQSYCIRLASGHNVEEVKKEFVGNYSVQVYSVQTCIPKDLAVLWNAEFVQVEELFNQPSTTENCLRDNRFCGVSNFFVKRTLDGKPVGAVSQLKNDTRIFVKTNVNSSLKGSPALPPLPPQQGPVAQSSSKHGMQPSTLVTSGNRSDRTTPVVNDQSSKSHVKEPTASAQTNIKKLQNEKASSGSGGSLASFWGRASAKSNPSSPALGTTTDVPNIAFSAEAQICAYEAADALSSDDDGIGSNHKRESNGASNRKRRVVMDFSDDEEDENVVSLASPNPPDGKPSSDTLCTTGKLIVEKKNPSLEDHKDDKLENKQDKIKEQDSGLPPECKTRDGSKKNSTRIPLQKKPQIDSPKEHADINGNKNGNDKISTSSCSSPKRRKVLKTRIDERGREVTEVVWEDEAGNNNTEKKVANNDVASRPPVDKKAVAAGTNTSTNPASKAGNKKSAKGGGKDAKQGNILSFFKKV